MLKNYFMIAFRSFKRNKLFSFINMTGLAIGISAALVIYLIVQYEFSFDTFHKDKNRMYRVVSNITYTDLSIHNSGVAIPLPNALRQEVTGLDVVTQFLTAYDVKVSIAVPGSQSPAVFLRQKDIVYADNFYFKYFDYEWLAGSALTALKDPYQVVLTESRARSYFADHNWSNIVGKEILYDDSIKVTVAGVVKDFTKATDIRFKEFVSLATVAATGLKEQWNWAEWNSINSSSQCLVKLSKGTSSARIEKQLVALREKYREKPKEPKKDEKDDTKNILQAFNDIHFNTDYDNFSGRIASKPTLYGLLAVAAFLLLLGCINFINLTTAQSSQRAKEIGIRKTMGSGKGQLIAQFLAETFSLTLLATILSVFLTPWLLKVFHDFIPPEISFSSVNQPHVWIFLLLLTILISLIAGFYPALVLTKFKPVTVLKNQAHSGTSQSRKAWLRKTLTVTQFVIAQFLIIATLVVSKQVHYSLNKQLGYKTDAIVSFWVPWNVFSEKQDDSRFVFQRKLSTMLEFEKVSLSGSAPASGNTNTTGMKYNNGKEEIETMVETKTADTNYFDLFKMKLLAGRNLQQSDTAKELVINETYSKLLGFKNPQQAIGHFIEYNHMVPIVGVIADFHSKSTHVAIKPLAFISKAWNSYNMHLALRQTANNGESWKAAMEKVGKMYKEMWPDSEFSYEFYDESIANFYKAEKNVSSLLKWAAGLCIFISCLGLLGLVIYITNSRTKEIGVRKVLGATVTQIISLLSRDFIVLVFLAFLITVPVAWWVMHNWLQDFQYRTTLSWWIFAATGGGMLLIAMLILGFRTLRSATRNPVESLRTE